MNPKPTGARPARAEQGTAFSTVIICVFSFVFLGAASTVLADTFRVVESMPFNEGFGTPLAGLTLSADGTMLYGTKGVSGQSANGGGTGAVFSIGVDGTNYNVLRPLPHGNNPLANASAYAPVVLGGSTLYGTTLNGGSGAGVGIIYSIGTDGSGFQTLHSFGAGGDAGSNTPLTLVGSTLYGTSLEQGNLYSIGTNGASYQVLHSFGGYDSGQVPLSGLLQVGSTLYGTAVGFGSPQSVLYTFDTASSSFQTAFTFPNGDSPMGDLTQIGSTLFGMFHDGDGASGGPGGIFSVNLDGSNFQVLHHFGGGDGAVAGFLPAPPVQFELPGGMTAVGNTLYGTTTFSDWGAGGAPGGEIFSINSDGSNFQIVHSFSPVDGYNPYGDLTLVGNTLYGTTSAGGLGAGTIYAITVPEPSGMLLAVIAATGLAASLVRRARFRWRALRLKRSS